jgi:putative hydrolase of the HAD superfamily
VDGLLFDLDNTLLDREAAFFRVARAFHGEHLRGEASATRDDAVATMVRWDEDGYANREAILSRWLTKWPDTGLTMGSLTKWYRSTMKQKVQPDTAVNGFLAELNERGVPWGIVTNGRTSQRGKCRAAGLEQLAPFTIVSEEAGYRKPDPRIFRDALEATGLREPQQAMFVGDNPLADIDGAKRFGMKTAWIRRGRRYPSGLHPPDHVIDRVTDLPDIVGIQSQPM